MGILLLNPSESFQLSGNLVPKPKCKEETGLEAVSRMKLLWGIALSHYHAFFDLEFIILKIPIFTGQNFPQ